ncbi:MAG: efflux RND transporter periplasmic adaptor subunit [Deltaproteobacteria bacterium]
MPASNFFSRIRTSRSAWYKLLAAAAAVVIIILSFSAGYLSNHDQETVPAVKPGSTAQIQDDQPSGDADEEELPPGTVQVSPAKQQLMGLKIGVVKKAAYSHLLKVPGRVVADETRIYQINAGIEGWITKIYDNTTTGGIVKKDQLLALYASPNLLTAQQAYLNALVSQERYALTVREKVQQLTRPERTTKQLKDVLSSLGMTDTQLEQITESRDWDEYVQIRAPGPGFILKRNVTDGLRFDKGAPLYTIADLSRIWIVADLYENDALYFQPGKTVGVTLPGQSKNLTARVSNILPQFDPASRTLKVRLEANNPGYRLRPDMFVDVELPITTKPGIFIPADAILDTGFKKTVFVARGQGSFEPRPVTTGQRLGSFVEIEHGLAEGERIVLAGNFLLDAESKLELAAAGVNAALEMDPVCGMSVAPRKAQTAGRKSLYQGKTYFFCSDDCKQRFDRHPESFLMSAGNRTGEQAGEQAQKQESAREVKRTGRPAPDHSAAGVSAALAIDPVCGMSVSPEKAQTAGLTSLYKGKAYFFCSDSCKRSFESNPESFLQAGKKTGASGPDHTVRRATWDAPEHTGDHAGDPAGKPAAAHVEKHSATPAGELTEEQIRKYDGEDQ